MNRFNNEETFQNLSDEQKQDYLEQRTIGVLIHCPEWLQEQNIKTIKSMFTYEYHCIIVEIIMKSFIGGMFSKTEFFKNVSKHKEEDEEFERYVLKCMDLGYELFHLDTDAKDEKVILSYFNELQKSKNKRTLIERISKCDGSLSSITNCIKGLSETFDTKSEISISGQMYASDSLFYGEKEIPIIEDLLVGYNVSVVAAEPKLGKTTLCLQIAKAVSTGTPLLSYPASQGEVLYLSYDQSQNQMNTRIHKSGLTQCNIIFDYKEKGLSNIGVKELNQYIHLTKKRHPQLKLVIVDMFKNIRNLTITTEYSGTVMMDDMQALKKAAQDNKVHIILIHETNVRSSKNANDKLYGGQKIASETNGSLIKLLRESPHSDSAIINVDGRNVGAYEIMVKFDANTMSFHSNEQMEEELDQNIIKIINYVTHKKEFVGTIQELCSACRLIDYNPTKVGKMLRKDTIIRVLNENGIQFEDLRKVKGNRTIRLRVDETL